jgi:ankyrin repeat protein
MNRAGSPVRTTFDPTFCTTTFLSIFYSEQMATPASQEDVVEAQKREIEALKRALKQCQINASYYNTARLQVPHHVWVKVTVLRMLNMFHSDFFRGFFDNFRALVKEENHEAYVDKLADYIRWMKSQFMFVRVERPGGSKHFVLGYVKCDWVFSFALRVEQMRSRLNRVPPMVLTDAEHGENKALRLACVGETDYERAMARHRNDDGRPPLSVALWAKDEESAMALLDGGDDPNEVDFNGYNALHRAAEKGCCPPLVERLLARIHNVNAVNKYGWTALMRAAYNNHLDVVILLMNHPGIDLNVQNRGNHNSTALHYAVRNNHPAIVSQLLSDDKMDASLKDRWNNTPFKVAIDNGYVECGALLRQHGGGRGGGRGGSRGGGDRHVELRGPCIAAPVPGTFRTSYGMLGDQFLHSAQNQWNQQGMAKESAYLAMRLGGPAALSPAALPECHPSSSVLTKRQRDSLVAYIDASVATQDEPSNDYILSLSRPDLVSIVGERTTAGLEQAFGGTCDAIRMRRVTASGLPQGECISFHTDFSRRTMQVFLNSEHEYRGGLLMFASSQGFVAPKRTPGSYSIHNHTSVHGVTSITEGTRYSLFLCQTVVQDWEKEEKELFQQLQAKVFGDVAFCERAVRLLDDMHDDTLSATIEHEYPAWWSSDKKKTRTSWGEDTFVYPSLTVEIVSRVCMLRPVAYANAESMCTVEDVRKHQTFMKRILKSHAAMEHPAFMENSVAEYLNFLRSAGSFEDNPENSQPSLEPSLAVDWVWHGHMQLSCGRAYRGDAVRLAGRMVDHVF